MFRVLENGCTRGAWEGTLIYKSENGRRMGNNADVSPPANEKTNGGRAKERNRKCERLKVEQRLGTRTDRNYVYSMAWKTRTIFTHVLLQPTPNTEYWLTQIHTHTDAPGTGVATETICGIGENDTRAVSVSDAVVRTTTISPAVGSKQPTQHRAVNVHVRVRRLLEWCVIFPGGILFNANFAIFVNRIFFVRWFGLRCVCAVRVGLGEITVGHATVKRTMSSNPFVLAYSIISLSQTKLGGCRPPFFVGGNPF